MFATFFYSAHANIAAMQLGVPEKTLWHNKTISQVWDCSKRAGLNPKEAAYVYVMKVESEYGVEFNKNVYFSWHHAKEIDIDSIRDAFFSDRIRSLVVT